MKEEGIWHFYAKPCLARLYSYGERWDQKIFFNWKGNNRNAERLCNTSIPTFNILRIIFSIKTSRAQSTKKIITGSSSMSVKTIQKDGSGTFSLTTNWLKQLLHCS